MRKTFSSSFQNFLTWFFFFFAMLETEWEMFLGGLGIFFFILSDGTQFHAWKTEDFFYFFLCQISLTNKSNPGSFLGQSYFLCVEGAAVSHFKRWRLSYLKVFKRNPPLIGWIFGGARDEQRPTVVGDGLAAVRVLSRSINVSAAVECGFGAVVLQLHGVQREPAASRHLVVTLAHGKAGCTQTHGGNSDRLMEVTGGDGEAPCPLVSLIYRAESLNVQTELMIRNYIYSFQCVFCVVHSH